MSDKPVKPGKIRESWKSIKRLVKGTPGPFDYGLLPLDGPHETRYVQLYAGHESDEIEIDMVVADVKQKYSFAALSYVWGSRENPLPVYMGTYPRYVFHVTRNLHAALRHVRRSIAKGKSIFMWIDALCINQQDDNEKAQQIPLMPFIYPEANTTYCYLGESSETTAATFEFCKECYRCTARNDAKGREALLNRLTDELEQPKQPLLTGLRALLSHPWFERAWILQESCRPFDDSPIMFQGSSNMQLAVLVPVLYYMQAPYEDGGSTKEFYNLDCLPAISCVAIATKPRNEFTFINLLEAMSKRKAEQPRDKLYALLGLLPNPEVYPPPDYKRDELEVCLEYTRSIFQQGQSLELLTRMAPRSSAKCSWCLDVRSLSVSSARPSRMGQDGSVIPDYAAAGDRPPAFLPQGLAEPVLRLRGCIIDTIKLSIMPEHLEALRKAGLASWTDVVKTLHEVISRLGLPPIYVHTHEPIDVALARILTCDSFFALPTEWRAHQHDHFERFYASYETALAGTDDTAPAASQDQLLDWARAKLSFCSSTPKSAVELDPRIAELLTQKAAGLWAYAMRRAEGELLSFVTTSRGYMGWAPMLSSNGDVAVVFPGSNVPLVLRPRGPRWQYVGPSPYMHGIMYGEAFDDALLQDFEIV